MVNALVALRRSGFGKSARNAAPRVSRWCNPRSGYLRLARHSLLSALFHTTERPDRGKQGEPRRACPRQARQAARQGSGATRQARPRWSARRVCSGTVGINAHGLLDVALPFGGMNQSGFGREYGAEGVLAYTELKSVAALLGA
ncbi:MAG: aldehyde dehydrogenase family protein [Novosphingobium sp.]|nr:aldehyde dehydrogenase family protein [Novosphingobium sp.]